MARLALASLTGLPEIRAGDDLGQLLADALPFQRPPLRLADRHIVAIAQKAVSKSEGALVALRSVRPGDRALALASKLKRDARVLQVVLEQSAEVIRAERGVLICRTDRG